LSRLLATILALVTLATATPVGAQQTLARFEVLNVVFSPDGDGVEDVSSVTFTLGASASSVTAVIFAADSITPIDTLLAPQPRGIGRVDMAWDGLDFLGAPVGDGGYLVTLSVSAAQGDTTATRRVFVDTVVPAIVIDSVSPSPYGPGSPGTSSEVSIAFTLTAASPIYTGIPADEIQWTFENPDGDAVEPDSLRLQPEYAGADGSYQLIWNAVDQGGLASGDYLVTLTVIDQAGHTANSDHTFVLDSRAPEIKLVSPRTAQSFQNPPAELTAWARDVTGVDSLTVRYREGGPRTPVVIDRVSADTTFFHTPLADSLGGEGSYSVVIRAVDGVLRPATTTLNITVDRTAPDPPHLDPFDGVWRTNEFRVTGTFPSGGGSAARVRIYRNGALVDTVLTLTVSSIDRVIQLVPGTNVITAIFVDAALNASLPSNALNVEFDNGSGLFVSAPMRPGDYFDLNLSETAAQAEVRIYDLSGDLVVVLEDSSNKQYYSLYWDGRNGSGDRVKRGPLVAVATVVRYDGGKDTFRELFLFDPEAEQ
jgi:flagellar hook assembly protein FlgD